MRVIMTIGREVWYCCGEGVRGQLVVGCGMGVVEVSRKEANYEAIVTDWATAS